MNLNINTQNLELLEGIRSKIEKNLQSLNKFTKSFGEKADLEITLIRITNHHEQGNIYSGQAKFQIPGKDIFCKEEGNSIEEVTNRLRDRLKRLLVEKKEIKQSKWKKIAKIFRKVK
ncbi:MAG: HPF/RaiA family ribosome-associated protein [Minisyncoccia bacterium]